MLSPESMQENRTRNVPSGKMLLERLGLHQCQGGCVQPVRSKSRVHLEGASVIVQQVAKHPNICRHRWNPNPKRARNSRNILCEQVGNTQRAMHIHLPESAVTLFQRVLSHLNNRVNVTPHHHSWRCVPMQCDLSRQRLLIVWCCVRVTICLSAKCHLPPEVVQCWGQKV